MTRQSARRRRVDGDAGLGAGDARGDGVGRGDRSAARGLERHAEGARALVADGERVVGRQHGRRVAAGEVHGAGVAGGDVTVGIARGDPEGDRVCPAVVVVGSSDIAKMLAAAGVTVMPACVPVMFPVTVSVAVIDRLPAVLSVTLKVCVPWSPPTKV